MAKKSPFSDPILLHLHELVTAQLGELNEIEVLKPEDYFQTLCASIISQQLSTKVADTIFSRVKALVGEPFSPERVLQIPEDEFRAVGMSYAKARYVRAVAEAWQSGLIDPFKVEAMDDETLINHLTQIKGVGRWTAEMFLIFSLGRSDIFSVGDYGLRKALTKAYGIPMETPPAELLKITDKWKPYRSLASRILWKSLELPK
jgi:DNA-3-methyladenine glycosylase II